MTPIQAVVALVAGFGAGAINAIAGGGTLIAFPVLLWAGVPPVIANATTSVALWPGLVSATYGYRRELASIHRPLLLLSIPCLAGGVAGALLLVDLSSESFEVIAPYLLLFATLLIAGREVITRLFGVGSARQSLSPLRWIGAVAALTVIATYGGYFGAGMGVLILAALSMLGMTDMNDMNALKNLYTVALKGSALVYFALSGTVSWAAAGFLAAGAIAGGWAAAHTARRAGGPFVRRAVVATGLVLSLSLLIRLYA